MVCDIGYPKYRVSESGDQRCARGFTVRGSQTRLGETATKLQRSARREVADAALGVVHVTIPDGVKAGDTLKVEHGGTTYAQIFSLLGSRRTWGVDEMHAKFPKEPWEIM